MVSSADLQKFADSSATLSTDGLRGVRALPLQRRANFATPTYRSGTKKTPMTVAAVMPPITPIPIEFWLPEPAPVAIASGVTPSTNASYVIKIGRSRFRAASKVASIMVFPLRSCSIANSTIRIAFFAARPIVVSRPTLK